MAREIICGIYKITSPNNSVYIGQSTDIYKRFEHYHNESCKKQKRLYNSFKKYGSKNHKFEIIHQCDEGQLNELEKYYVDLFQSFNNKMGLNLKDGGGAYGKHSQETIEKIRQASTGRKIPNRKWTESQRSKFIKTMTGIKRPDMANRTGEKHPKSLCVIQMDRENNFINKYISLSDAEKHIGIGNSHISQACRGIRMTAGGFKWMYAKDYYANNSVSKDTRKETSVQNHSTSLSDNGHLGANLLNRQANLTTTADIVATWA